jgi:hypothetical protein
MNCIAENQENYPRRERRGLGKRLYAVTPHKSKRPIAKSVKTRRKSLSDNKVYLQKLPISMLLYNKGDDSNQGRAAIKYLVGVFNSCIITLTGTGHQDFYRWGK